MQERVFKVEVNDELYDLLEIRIQDKREIEIFVLTQALGLLDLLERKIILTSQCKKSIFAMSFELALVLVAADPEVINVIGLAEELQGGLLEVSDEISEQAKELRERVVELLKERLLEEQIKKREWCELYNFDAKTLRRMHEEVRAKREKEIAEMVRRREQMALEPDN